MLFRWAVALLACAAAPAAGQTAPAAVKIDSSWLHSNGATKTAEFSAIAALTPLNAGMNFDGAKDGNLTLTVPLGWTVVLHFTNDDQVLPHSLEVVTDSGPVPVGPVTPAFAHAATPSLEQGLGAEGKADVTFAAARAGAYRIFCAVPGHGAAGMWIRLVVSPDAKAPSLQSR